MGVLSIAGAANAMAWTGVLACESAAAFLASWLDVETALVVLEALVVVDVLDVPDASDEAESVEASVALAELEEAEVAEVLDEVVAAEAADEVEAAEDPEAVDEEESLVCPAVAAVLAEEEASSVFDEAQPRTMSTTAMMTMTAMMPMAMGLRGSRLFLQVVMGEAMVWNAVPESRGRFLRLVLRGWPFATVLRFWELPRTSLPIWAKSRASSAFWELSSRAAAADARCCRARRRSRAASLRFMSISKPMC